MSVNQTFYTTLEVVQEEALQAPKANPCPEGVGW